MNPKNVEFKVQRPKDSIKYMKTVIAFSNGEGGRIVFGVDDDTREVVGIPKENVFRRLMRLLQQYRTAVNRSLFQMFTYRRLRIRRSLLLRSVRENQRPYYIKSMGIKDGTYIRVSGTSRPAGRDLTAENVL